MASERLGASSCIFAHVSTFAQTAADKRIDVTGLFPVAGRPEPGLAPPCLLRIAFFMARSTFFKLEKQAARHDRVILLSIDMPAEGERSVSHSRHPEAFFHGRARKAARDEIKKLIQ